MPQRGCHVKLIIISLKIDTFFNGYELCYNSIYMEEKRSGPVLFGIIVDAVSQATAVKTIHAWMEDGGTQHTIATLNPEFVMEALNDNTFHAILARSSMVLPDGIGIIIAERIIYGSSSISQRVTGIDLLSALALSCAGHYSHRWYLLGGEHGAGRSAAQVLSKDVIIAGWNEGLIIRKEGERIAYDHQVNDRIIQDIRQSNATIVLVAFGHPKQEKWIEENRKLLPHVRVFIGVGGSFDFIAGRVKRAPQWMRAVGLEWLWRLYMEPYRLPRIITATIHFMREVMRERGNVRKFNQ